MMRLRACLSLLLVSALAVPAQGESTGGESTQVPVVNVASAVSLVAGTAVMVPETIDLELKSALMRAVNLQELDFGDRFDAQVWMMGMSTRLTPFVKDEQERLELLHLVRREAVIAGVPPELVLAVIQVESRFNRYAVSRVGAQGMMQVMPFWKKELGRPDDNLIETATNLRYGCTILKYYLDKEKGNVPEALARYNGSTIFGPYPGLVLRAYENRWKGGAL